MKTRIISAIVLVLICVPPLLLGGIYIKLLAAFVAVVGSYEFINIREKDFNIPLYVGILLYILAVNIFKDNIVSVTILFTIALFIGAIITPKLDINDVSLALLVGTVIAYAVHATLTIYTFNEGPYLMLFILLATFGSDTMALFTGMAFGKHKLCERISPKKTIEGAIGGWISGAIISFVFAHFFITSLDTNVITLLAITLPVIGQIGDLSFSMIKRHFKIKDFGNLIPGHGGVLDRCDSLIFCLIYFIAVVGMFI